MSANPSPGGGRTLSEGSVRSLTPFPNRLDDVHSTSQRTRPAEPGTRDVPPSMPGEEGVVARSRNGAPRWLVGFLSLAGVFAAARPASGQG
jgi:hypothetical protein